jgi:GNAT superfamily N-acetyltransferase
MELQHLDDVDDFLAAAGDFLAAREAEHNLLFGICSGIRAAPEIVADDPPRFAVVTDHYGAVVAATLRTPPFQQLLSEVDELAGVDLIVGALIEAGDRPPGVLGPTEAAARFAELWSERTGQRNVLAMSERIFRLERVVPPRRATGAWRIAEDRDRELLRDWILTFRAEAVPEDPLPPDLDGIIDRWIRRIGRTMYLWEDEGRPVSLVGVGGETPNGCRIGPVYTPREFRGRGYASSLTAVASQDQLDSGRRFCFLFTDLANPTSNHIYRQIGYEPVSDVDQYRFVPTDGK